MTTNLEPCEICWAQVAPEHDAAHRDWHGTLNNKSATTGGATYKQVDDAVKTAARDAAASDRMSQSDGVRMRPTH